MGSRVVTSFDPLWLDRDALGSEIPVRGSTWEFSTVTRGCVVMGALRTELCLSRSRSTWRPNALGI